VDDDTDGDVYDDEHDPDGQRQRPYYEQQTVVADVRSCMRPTVGDSVSVCIGGARTSQHNADTGRFYRHAKVDYVTQRRRHRQDES